MSFLGRDFFNELSCSLFAKSSCCSKDLICLQSAMWSEFSEGPLAHLRESLHGTHALLLCPSRCFGRDHLTFDNMRMMCRKRKGCWSFVCFVSLAAHASSITGWLSSSSQAAALQGFYGLHESFPAELLFSRHHLQLNTDGELVQPHQGHFCFQAKHQKVKHGKSKSRSAFHGDTGQNVKKHHCVGVPREPICYSSISAM